MALSQGNALRVAAFQLARLVELGKLPVSGAQL
jgi:hypothetical protein